jgi:gluconolactonase
MRRKLTNLIASSLLTMAALPAMAQTAPDGPRHSLSEICKGGKCVWEKVVTCSGFIEGINFDAQGRLWMVGLRSGEIFRVENGACVSVGEKSGRPNGAKFDGTGRLIIADRSSGIIAVDSATGVRTQLHTQYKSAVFRGLNDLVFAADGGYYFTEPYGSDALSPTGRVFYVGPGEKAVPELHAEGMAFPNGIALSADGERVYIAEYAQNRIISFASKTAKNPNAFPSVFAHLEGGNGPDGLAVDSEGNLYIAHYGAGEIVVIDSNGFKYGALRLPQEAGLGTTNVAIHSGFLYVTEALKNDVWRVAINKTELKSVTP